MYADAIVFSQNPSIYRQVDTEINPNLQQFRILRAVFELSTCLFVGCRHHLKGVQHNERMTTTRCTKNS
jgi:hypothetical protein